MIQEVRASLCSHSVRDYSHPLSQVAVNEISVDAVMPEEIIYQINMISGCYEIPHPASVPVPEAVESPLTEEQFQEAVAHYLNSTGTSGRFFDNLRPPEFSWERKDFEVWQQRFT